MNPPSLDMGPGEPGIRETTAERIVEAKLKAQVTGGNVFVVPDIEDSNPLQNEIPFVVIIVTPHGEVQRFTDLGSLRSYFGGLNSNNNKLSILGDKILGQNELNKTIFPILSFYENHLKNLEG